MKKLLLSLVLCFGFSFSAQASGQILFDAEFKKMSLPDRLNYCSVSEQAGLRCQMYYTGFVAGYSSSKMSMGFVKSLVELQKECDVQLCGTFAEGFKTGFVRPMEHDILAAYSVDPDDWRGAYVKMKPILELFINSEIPEFDLNLMIMEYVKDQK